MFSVASNRLEISKILILSMQVVYICKTSTLQIAEAEHYYKLVQVIRIKVSINRSYIDSTCDASAPPVEEMKTLISPGCDCHHQYR